MYPKIEKWLGTWWVPCFKRKNCKWDIRKSKLVKKIRGLR